ncbi:MAG: dihydrolipoyl dehydrogenase [Desulfobacterales bacterium]|jgi:dihydrolipoamide dehydrogenase|nr:dihydrolipoyl dehydrogenase [Desulfobacterales bacterium]
MAKTERYDLVVIGSGPGGYTAAAKAARLGLKTACIEKRSRLGGVCLNVGCIPSKALLDASEQYYAARHKFPDMGIKTGKLGIDLNVMMSRKRTVVEGLTDNIRNLLTGNQVDIIHGTARVVSEDRVEVSDNQRKSGKGKITPLQTDRILIATGSAPSAVPGLAFDKNRIVNSTDALSFPSVPKHLIIVGGGYIGLELGAVWRRLGTEVTIVEMMPQIAGTLDGQVARTLQRILTRQGITFRTGTKVSGAKVLKSSIQVSVSDGSKEDTLSGDHVLVAVGRMPLTGDLGLEDIGVAFDAKTGRIPVNEKFQTNISSVYAIGDVIAGPMLAHKASAEGTAVADIMTGLPGEVNYDTIPSIIYTWPEVASVGLTEEAVKARKIPHCIGTFPFSGSGRARCMGETDGFVKLIAHSKTDRLIGAHILGPRASDMIAECVLAMEFGASLEDIARTVHGHPTLAETLQEAAGVATKCSIYR